MAGDTPEYLTSVKTTAKYWRRAGFVALLLIVAQMMDEPLMLIVSRQPAFCQYIVSCRF